MAHPVTFSHLCDLRVCERTSCRDGRHPSGANFGFCDGSVRFFRNGSDPNKIRFLAGRNDGEVINPDF